MTDPGVISDREASPGDRRGGEKIVEDGPGRTAGEIERECRSAQLAHHARHVDPASAGIVALVYGPHLVDGSDGLSLRGSVNRRVEGERDDGFHLAPSKRCRGPANMVRRSTRL